MYAFSKQASVIRPHELGTSNVTFSLSKRSIMVAQGCFNLRLSLVDDGIINKF